MTKRYMISERGVQVLAQMLVQEPDLRLRQKLATLIVEDIQELSFDSPASFDERQKEVLTTVRKKYQGKGKGGRRRYTKITPQMKTEARDKFANGMTAVELQKEYGFASSTCSRILSHNGNALRKAHRIARGLQGK